MELMFLPTSVCLFVCLSKFTSDFHKALWCYGLLLWEEHIKFGVYPTQTGRMAAILDAPSTECQ